MTADRIPFKKSKKNKVPDELNVSLFDLIILYQNVFNAKDIEEIGYQNLDESYYHFVKRLKEYRVNIKQKDLEAGLWACSMLSENKKAFWHPEKVSYKKWLTKIVQHKQLRFYFDKFYNRFIATKPRNHAGRELISSDDSNESED